ncbi:uncharacterized protein LOC102153469 isoform X2 [Canis lupus familiaris]|uniref:uncharacterized protein LOC102153469 isoform X2 n=2 Tax=Canis lupus familiaris TaxID=9615 RepID=UPI000BAA1052|nr:uncharacterized protein LOC102153469 isoform X2 [Canis lupus familiaris]XP_038421336.1 uncharacterized protein LOC102153469 isoform X2 [Canis lupus familiaris]|eukprot:XP_022261995.1 uncharacterized protein LOC102153521 isoform X2 [Canis lupus familiaris]
MINPAYGWPDSQHVHKFKDLVCEIQEEMGNPSPEISTSGPPSDHWRKSTSGHTRVQEFCSDCRRGNVLDTPRTSPSVLKRQTRQGRFWPRNRVNPAADTEEEGPLEVSPDGGAEEGAPYLPKVDAGGKESFPTEDLIADLPPATEEEEAPKVSEVNAGRKENDPFFIKIHFPCQNIRMEEDLCVENLED